MEHINDYDARRLFGILGMAIFVSSFNVKIGSIMFLCACAIHGIFKYSQ